MYNDIEHDADFDNKLRRYIMFAKNCTFRDFQFVTKDI